MFNVGDRVVINEPNKSAWKNVHGTFIGMSGSYLKIAIDPGSLYHFDHILIGGNPVDARFIAGGYQGYACVSRLHVSLEATPVKEKTPKELADRYRESLKEEKALREERLDITVKLSAQGYETAGYGKWFKREEI